MAIKIVFYSEVIDNFGRTKSSEEGTDIFNVLKDVVFDKELRILLIFERPALMASSCLSNAFIERLGLSTWTAI